MATNGVNHQEHYAASVSSAADISTTSNSNNNLSKDEVGWYFVEQYYTTLSKSPDKLHLFYGKKSQFVYGLEAEVANVSVGRHDILERIKKLDFQDCKVRISNVDSQASVDNIVIQVIGETSNKSEEPRKFVQTFVLAQQPSGYFVLNDILRYIKEEDEEPAEAGTPLDSNGHKAPAPATQIEPESETDVEAEDVAAKTELDPAAVDKKLEEVTAKDTPSPIAVTAPAEPAIPAPAQKTVSAKLTEAVAMPAKVSDLEKAALDISDEEAKKSETPKEPSSTPASAPTTAPSAEPTTAPAAVPAEPEKPKGPAKPMTWASRAAAAAGPLRPAVALPKTAAPQVKPAAPAPSIAPAKAAPAETHVAGTAPATPAPTVAFAAPAAKGSGNDWQTAGSDYKRQNRPLSISGPIQDKDNTLGYVKYVTEKVDDESLRSHLQKFGAVAYFDINRTKNCAFIEFANPAGYLAAVAANPHNVCGENIVVEARRPRASAYGGANYNNNRGGIAGRGRGGYENRNGSQGGGRGGFPGGQNRPRGGAGGAARGRGGAQIAA